MDIKQINSRKTVPKNPILAKSHLLRKKPCCPPGPLPRIPPAFCVDITPYIEKKMEIIQCFKSQFYDPDSTEPVSPISSKGFLEYLKSISRIHGRPIGAEFAEGYTVERAIGVKDMLSLV